MSDALIRGLFAWLARRHLFDRPRKRDNPQSRRFTRGDIRALVREMKQQARELIAAADLGRLKSRGNRFNTTLGLYHVALYRGLRGQGVADDEAIRLAREIGWTFYAAASRYLYWLVRPFVWNKQKQINSVLRILMIFPFNRDPNGYQFTIKNEADHMRTDWTQCVVLEAIKRSGNEADLNFFRHSWCQYDFHFPALISQDGYYEREHTLSFGDGVCDMKWYARRPSDK
jgi:hypothetical protein